MTQAKETIKTPYAQAIAFYYNLRDTEGGLRSDAKIMLETLYAKREGWLAGYEAGSTSERRPMMAIVCPLCGRIYTYYSWFQKHYIREHPENKKGVREGVGCLKCGKEK